MEIELPMDLASGSFELEEMAVAPKHVDRITIDRRCCIGASIIKVGPDFTVPGVFPHGLAVLDIEAIDRVSIIGIAGEKEPTIMDDGT